MAITLEYLQDRYNKANSELDAYGAKLSDKLANGTASSKAVRKFNLMSAWISFMGSRLEAPILTEGVSPKSITLPIPCSEQLATETPVGVIPYTNLEFCLGIENYNGRFIPVVKISNYNPYTEVNGSKLTCSEYLQHRITDNTSKDPNRRKYIDDMGVYRGDFTFTFLGKEADTFKINLPKTSDFNGQKFVASSNTSFGEYAITLAGLGYGAAQSTVQNLVSGGVNDFSSGKFLTTEVKDVYNKALEDIAIELNIIYW